METKLADGVIQLRYQTMTQPSPEIPWVNACGCENTPMPSLRIDNVKAAESAVDHLIGLGHQLNTIQDVQQFLNGTQAVAFSVATDKQARYQWIQSALVKHCYLALNKADKGVITRYLMKVTSYSLAQTKRLLQQYAQTGHVRVKLARNNGFKRAYTDADIRLLARIDECHGQPSGAVLKKLCERACHKFNTSA